jgi:hypothetical protein
MSDMPVRFRCSSCHRLLGIARRKIGSQIACPQCGASVTVPEKDDPVDTPPPMSALPPRETHPATDDAQLGIDIELLVPPKAVATAPPPRNGPPKPAAAPAPAPAAPRRRPGEEAPLFEGKDFDALLGLPAKGGQPLELDEKPAGKKKPVSGSDALSLDDEARPLVLTPQKATLLIVAVVVFLGVAFAAGFLIASRS